MDVAGGTKFANGEDIWTVSHPTTVALPATGNLRLG
jgi:hypothetical protein